MIGLSPRRICRFLSCSIYFLLITSWLSACSSTPSTSKLTPVTLQLSWLHQAQFAGLYAADQRGYYTEEGPDISFVEGGPDVDFISPVANGAAQFGMDQPADLILARAQGMPVRSIEQVYAMQFLQEIYDR